MGKATVAAMAKPPRTHASLRVTRASPCPAGLAKSAATCASLPEAAIDPLRTVAQINAVRRRQRDAAYHRMKFSRPAFATAHWGDVPAVGDCHRRRMRASGALLLLSLPSRNDPTHLRRPRRNTHWIPRRRASRDLGSGDTRPGRRASARDLLGAPRLRARARVRRTTRRRGVAHLPERRERVAAAKRGGTLGELPRGDDCVVEAAGTRHRASARAVFRSRLRSRGGFSSHARTCGTAWGPLPGASARLPGRAGRAGAVAAHARSRRGGCSTNHTRGSRCRRRHRR